MLVLTSRLASALALVLKVSVSVTVGVEGSVSVSVIERYCYNAGFNVKIGVIA